MRESDPPETPAEEIPQDPGIPGRDTVSDGAGEAPEAPAPVEGDGAELDDPDREGHMGAGT